MSPRLRGPIGNDNENLLLLHSTNRGAVLFRQSRFVKLVLWLDSWLLSAGAPVKTTSEYIGILALHVVAYAGFERYCPLETLPQNSDVKSPSTYRDFISIIVKNVLAILVLPQWVFRIPFCRQNGCKSDVRSRSSRNTC